MLEKITDYLVGKVTSTGYFEKIFPFVEMVTKGDKRYPGQYLELGEYKQVSDYDHYKGMCYFRMNGKQVIFNENNNGMDSSGFPVCEGTMNITFPMRMVACIPKSILSKDDAFTDERVSRSLFKSLITEGGTLKEDLDAISLSISPDTVTFDNTQVLSEEYQNVDKMRDVNYNYSYHCIDFRVVVKIMESCINSECEEEYYAG